MTDTEWVHLILWCASRQRADGAHVDRTIGPVRRVAQWLEDRSTRRLVWLSEPPPRTIFLAVAGTYGLFMPLMEVVPFASSLLGVAVVCIGLGLMLRDGILLLLSLVPSAFAAAIITQLLTW